MLRQLTVSGGGGIRLRSACLPHPMTSRDGLGVSWSAGGAGGASRRAPKTGRRNSAPIKARLAAAVPAQASAANCRAAARSKHDALRPFFRRDQDGRGHHGYTCAPHVPPPPSGVRPPLPTDGSTVRRSTGEDIAAAGIDSSVSGSASHYLSLRADWRKVGRGGVTASASTAGRNRRLKALINGRA